MQCGVTVERSPLWHPGPAGLVLAPVLLQYLATAGSVLLGRIAGVPNRVCSSPIIGLVSGTGPQVQGTRAFGENISSQFHEQPFGRNLVQHLFLREGQGIDGTQRIPCRMKASVQ